MATSFRDPMRLQLPTDELILETLLDGRNLAVNIAQEIDRSRNYINQRMGPLMDYGLVEKVGPAEDTGLYQITPKGGAVVLLSDQYAEMGTAEFEELVEQRAQQVEIRGPELVDHSEPESVDDVDS
jgi:predicted transcriptional regulator